jgi:hypothetical protein
MYVYVYSMRHRMPDAALLLVEKGIGKNRWVGLYDRCADGSWHGGGWVDLH